MLIKNIKDAEEVLRRSHNKVIGIGVTGFMRILPGFFLKNYEILCYKKSLDTDLISKVCKIKCISGETNIPLEKLNSPSIINNPWSKKYLKSGGFNYLYVYKSSKKLEEIAKQIEIKILSNKNFIREPFENKKKFREILKKIGIQAITGENITINKFLSLEHNKIKDKYGNKVVLQLPDIKNGGGLGTLFINSKNDFENTKNLLKDKKYREKDIKSINITKFLEGDSASIIGCATKYGTLTSTIQCQLIDIPEVINLKKGKGLFCGHDRSMKHFSEKTNKKADKLAKQIGDYMYKKGYKGIFGLDLIIDKKGNVNIVECNSRYTGAFPMISMIDIKNNVIPMDVFHLLEHMNIKYEINFNQIDKQYKAQKEGSHIILCNKSSDEIECKKDIKPGVYKIEKGNILRLRNGLSYVDIKNKNEFIITDGNPKKGDKINQSSELSRFCHLLFPVRISKNSNELLPKYKKLINNIYKFYTKGGL